MGARPARSISHFTRPAHNHHFLPQPRQLDHCETGSITGRYRIIDSPWLSAEGMVNAATWLHRHVPLESVYAVFPALDRAREAPCQVGYICQLFWQQTVGKFSEIFIRNLEDATTLSFEDVCRHLCTAVQHAIKGYPTRLEIALADLGAAVA
jgi:hypothetical protein